jgi:alpha-beta hydrolase superfamily lysophospholipase
MVRMSEFTFLSSDGESRIYCREYQPEGEAKGIVQIAHGLAEHIARYDDFARFLAEDGYIVVGNDHLGHGRSAASEAILGHFSDSGGWEKVVADMLKLHDRTAARFPGRPYFLLGHSMGSYLVRTYIIRTNKGLDGVILSGTGDSSRASLLAGRLAVRLEYRRNGVSYRSKMLDRKAFGKYNARITNPRTDFDWLSRDNAVVDAYVADPLCGRLSSAGLFRDLLDGMGFFTRPRNLARMKKDLPVYFLSGDCDPVGEYGEGVIRTYKSFLKAGMTNVTMKLYHGARHEIINELNHGEVYEDILEWLDGKVGR